MAYRLTLGTVRADCAKAINLLATDQRVIDTINEACETLLYGDVRTGSAKWPGVIGKYRFCPTNSCLSLPREIETVESWAIDSDPQVVRNMHYEFLGNGTFLMSDTDYNGYQLIDDGEACCFDDPDGGTTKRLAVYCDLTESASATISIRFYNSNNQKTRVEYPAASGEYIEGETLLLPSPGNYQLSTNVPMKSGLYQVIKPVTNGVIRLYEYDTVTLAKKPLGYYEPNELIPLYRRVRVPGLSKAVDPVVTILAKFRFIPAVSDNDPLQIPHAGAIRLACQAIHYEKAHLLEDAARAWQLAFTRLHGQLAHWRGSGASVPIKMANRSTWGAGGCSLR